MLLSYRHGRWAREALDSVLSQTYPLIQLITMDDGSSDGSADVVQQWLASHWPDAEFITHQTPSGNVPANLNEMIALARGDYLVCMAMDDLMAPERVQRQSQVLRSRPDAGMVHADVRIIDEFSNPSGELWSALSWQKPELPKHGHLFGYLMLGNFISAPSVMMRATTLQQVGRFDPKFPIHDDYPTWLFMARIAPIEYMQEIVGAWRRVSTSISNSKGAALDESRYAVKRHAAIMPPALGWDRRLVGDGWYRTLFGRYCNSRPTLPSDWWLLLRINRRPAYFVGACCAIARVPKFFGRRLANLATRLEHLLRRRTAR